ncbi:DUF3696 domain-containing protein [Amycolatopsis rhabdoformis]|uniref:DUF3696 domain-containing protein n=1 Tax=Amycolatopsis rhabdoformis TaxID=1448059 RepID=A0ABZ1HZW1_9PSEU|nr:DUF3696 domain-containing protein [Amycolatopsis rhabdoformis]WSE26920.1 DUF3696 domain-containing protein [Amycolatopsis rhabdoformis]
MPLTTLSVNNYRCFADEQALDLRPITCLLGRNNAGKSVLARAPLVISSGIQADSATPLDLDSLGDDIVGTFLDLIHGNRPHGSITIGLTFETAQRDSLSATVKVQNIDEYHTQVVSELTITYNTDQFSLIWQGGDVTGDTVEYVISGPGFERRDTPVSVAFQGLLPKSIQPDRIDAPEFDALISVCDKIRLEFDQIRYLGPFRERPSRFYRIPSKMPKDVGQSGENTAGILATDLVRNQGGLIKFINDRFSSNLPGWSIGTMETAGLYNIVLQSKTDPGIRVNLADTGTGIAQALPIFVQRALDGYYSATHNVLELVEQPELHLHPAAHGALADLYISAITDTKTRFVIETHSETFLLRLRRRIAEGEVDAADVAIYFVDNANGRGSTRRIRVDETGNLDYWPEGVFSEDYHEARKLALAQMSAIEDRSAH